MKDHSSRWDMNVFVLPGVFCSFGIMQRTKWGLVLFSVVINLVRDSYWNGQMKYVKCLGSRLIVLQIYLIFNDVVCAWPGKDN